MELAVIGPLTSASEALATAVGAGILLGSFIAGAVGMVLGVPRIKLSERVLTDGYFGGILAVLAVALDFGLL
jgi:hypothetical protein